MKIQVNVLSVDGANPSRTEREREAINILIRRVIGPEAELMHTPEGAPYIANSDIRISISHSRDYVALASCAEGDFGIDIEQPRPEQLRRVASRFLSTDEIEYYSASDELLLKAWTLKEAAYKALRNGPADLRLIRLPLDNESEEIFIGDRRLFIRASKFIRDDLYLSLVADMPVPEELR